MNPLAATHEDVHGLLDAYLDHLRVEKGLSVNTLESFLGGVRCILART